MNELAVSVVVYVFVMAGSLAGIYLNRVLPPEQIKDETRQAVNVATGIIATLAALVLGLMVASAKSSFDTRADDVRQIAARLFILDQTLRQYGPESAEARRLLQQLTEARLQDFRGETLESAGVPHMMDLETSLRRALFSLSASTEGQKWLLARALTLASELEQTRWLLIERSHKSIPRIFLVVLVFWLVVIFGSLGLFSPRNLTAYTVILICAFSVATAIFIVLEMDQPFEGILRVSDLPVRNALIEISR